MYSGILIMSNMLMNYPRLNNIIKYGDINLSVFEENNVSAI